MAETGDEGPGDGTAPEWDDLAKRYVDLWQQHIAALSADPGLADEFARLMQGMAGQGAISGFNPMMANPMMAAMFGAGAGDRRAGAVGAAAAGDASGERDDRVAELERRLAAMEARLDRLAGRDGGGD